MSAVANNQLSGIIEKFVFKSIQTPFANMPPRDIFTENFDDAIAQDGQVVHAHQNTTVYGSLNDLAKLVTLVALTLSPNSSLIVSETSRLVIPLR